MASARRASQFRTPRIHVAYRAPVMAWLGEDFTHPERVDLPTGHHLRPIRETDAEIDYAAVMGSRERLWAKYGEVWVGLRPS